MNRRQMLRLLAYTGVHLGNVRSAAAFFAGCAQRRVLGPSRQKLDRYGVTILVDGLGAQLFDRMLGAGELPNIQRSSRRPRHAR